MKLGRTELIRKYGFLDISKEWRFTSPKRGSNMPKMATNPAHELLLALQALGGLLEYRGERFGVMVSGGLVVFAVGRLEQIHFKLYAAVDQGTESKHASDLKLLCPSVEELQTAATWCRLQDASDSFAKQLDQAVAWFIQEQGHA
jgi:hypothetical protein